MAMSKVEEQGLPEELIIDILYRLPPKSIGLFRCVSMKWNTFLSDPQFINAHLTIHGHKEHEQKFILAFCGLLRTITLTQNPHDDLYDAISDKLNFEQLSDNCYTVHGSCNGLVLVEKRGFILCIINPTTLKYHEIPKFDRALPADKSEIMYGFGYDVVSDDYKVVTLSCYDTNEPDTFGTFVDVYSVRKGLWRRLENSPYGHARADKFDPGVLVNGALHWLTSKASHYSCVIAAFDLSDEKFSEVPLPDDKWCCFDFQLVALRGRLCTFINGGVDTVTLYICFMEDYGVKDSWTLFSITIPGLQVSFCTPLCLITDDDIVMDVDDKLMVYNMKKNVVWDLSIDAGDFMYKARTFVDSLVSPAYGFRTEG